MDITCHDASVLNPLLGGLPVDVVALATSQGPWGAAAEDAIMSTLRYADGTLAQTHDGFTTAFARTGLQVHGSEGSIEAAAAMVQDPVATIVLRDASGEREVEPEDRRDFYEINLAAFAAAVHGEGAPTATGLDGLRAVQVALAVREAAESGRRVSM
jgi:1,5-anhydro-D-fructose reductase (1,5-anhydro-D-mannitol-forming)